MTEGKIESGVVFAVSERLDGEQIERALFWSPDAEAIDADEWDVGQVGDRPETLAQLETPPILSASIELLPERRLCLLWREDVPNDAGVSICWTGRDWFAAIRDQRVVLQEGDVPTALHVRDDGSAREWLVPIVDPVGRVCWQPPQFTTYADALAALLDFPIRPAEAT